ncbi:Elongation factor Tu GTP binding domain [seawater metagenome]|uniref:Elongation factor Tu GTP binding domain n=1 Tax=seawater metagenome TaxID=1561972 RepID=A0A5E8CM43_9ZZZZ
MDQNKTLENKIKIAVCGPVDAGKSSLIGVLTSKQLDDGRGLARKRVLKHKHELDSGRTSNITFNNLIYETEDYKKVICLVDLAGHEKYLKTTVFGITGLFVDYGIVVIGANTGITRLTKEHLGILLYMNIPTIIVITKVDVAPTEVYKTTKMKLKRLLGRTEFGKKLLFLSDEESKAKEEVEHYLEQLSNQKTLIPVVSISNKTGHNVDNLHSMIQNLAPRVQWIKEDIQGSLFFIDSTFKVPGIGLVLSGTLKGNDIILGQKLWIGPVNGKFVEIRVRSLHNSIKEDVKQIYDGENSCIAIKFPNHKETLERDQIKKGMLIISNLEKYKKNVTWTFSAEVRILHHSTTIGTGYMPVLHCGPIRQSAKIELLDEDQDNSRPLRTGDMQKVRFRFAFHPEFVESGTVFFFRDGTTKGVGTVLEVL